MKTQSKLFLFFSSFNKRKMEQQYKHYRTLNLFIFSIIALFVSVFGSSLASGWNQFGNTQPTSQEERIGSGNLLSGITLNSINQGFLENVTYANLQVQPLNLFQDGSGYSVIMDSQQIRVYDKSLNLRGNIATPNANPVSQLAIDGNGYIVAGFVNSTAIVINKYLFDGSSLSIQATQTLNITNSSYMPTGLVYDYGNIVLIYDNPLKIALISDSNVLRLSNITASPDILRRTDILGAGSTIFHQQPLNAFDYNSDGVRDYLVYNDSTIFIFNETGNLMYSRNKSTSPASQTNTIMDVKYLNPTGNIIIATATSPKTSVPTKAGFFNITAVNISTNTLLWDKSYTPSYVALTLYRPENIQLAMNDINNDGVIDSIYFLLQNLDTNSFQQENNLVGVLSVTGSETINPFVHAFNVSYTSSKSYVARNPLTIADLDDDSFSDFLFTSAGKVLSYNWVNEELILGNTSSSNKGQALFNQNVYSACIPAHLNSLVDLDVICSSNTTLYHILPLVQTGTPTTTNISNTTQGNSGLNSLTDSVAGLFPDSDILSSKQKISYVLVFMIVTFFVIAIAFFLATKSLSPLAMYLIMFVEIMEFAYFVSIRYIPIGVVIAIVVLFGGVISLKFFRGHH